VKLESRAILFREMILLIVFLFLTGNEVLSQEVKGGWFTKAKIVAISLLKVP
jgi:hypothetical protein